MTYNRIQGQYNTENIPTSHLWGVSMCITNPDTKWKSDFGEKDNWKTGEDSHLAERKERH